MTGDNARPRRKRPSVAILGAGPAGVGAAFRLAKQGQFDVTVIERNSVVGGNAGSFDVAGMRVDYGSHRLHPSCHPQVLSDIRAMLGPDLLERPRHGRIFLKNRWLHFPLLPLDLLIRTPPQFAFGVMVDLMKKLGPFPARNESLNTFAAVLEAGLGRTICRDFYFPYARKIWGLPPEELAGTQAKKRVGANSLKKMLRKIIYSSSPNQPNEGRSFYYPRGGFGQISETYAKAAASHGAQFHFEATLRTLESTPDRVCAAIFRQRDREVRIPCDYLLSTIPITALARCLEGEHPDSVLAAAKSLEFRAMILIYLVLDQDRFTEFDAHYFPGEDVPITRLSEPKNYGLNGSPGTTVLCAELPCTVQDPQWEMSDEALGALVLHALSQASLPLKGVVKEIHVKRLGNAYPVYRSGFEHHFESIDRHFESYSNMVTFGRQGLFAHDNTHHALFMAYSAVECLHPNGKFDWSKWKHFRNIFETHVVED